MEKILRGVFNPSVRVLTIPVIGKGARVRKVVEKLRAEKTTLGQLENTDIGIE